MSYVNQAWMRWSMTFCVVIITSGWAASQTVTTPLEKVTFSESELDFFEKKVRPVLRDNCFECHSRSAKSVKGGLLLESRDAILRGGESGPAAKPGHPGESLLIAAVHYDELQMPPKKKLDAPVIQNLEHWVRLGLPWPPSDGASSAGLDRDGIVDAQQISEGRKFWSFQPISQIPLPRISDPSWPQTRIDHFVLAKLDERGLKPAPAADKRALLRRVYFDMLGLPPTFQELETFLSDDSTNAFEAVVDRLLASPQYGQRWARFWLDLVRYGEDHPNGALPPRFPHLYRDWLVNALNGDLPYDEFIRRQLAADHLENLPLEERAALGFLGLSPTYVIDEKFATEVVQAINSDEWEDRVDVVTRGLLGLTVACARCHDHKFDPITSADYYALAGVMASTQLIEQPTVSLCDEDINYIASLTEELRFHENRYNSRYNQRKGLIRDKEPDIYRYDKEILESASEIQRIKSLLPDNYESIPRVNAVRDAAQHVNPEFYVVRELVSPEAKFWRRVEYDAGKVRDLPIHIRGSVTSLGSIVPRRFIEVLSADKPQPFRHGSGRLELANAILTESAPLAGRVIVNRVWNWHFGQGLVRTPSNFGALGDRPSHPELLDDLTARFIRQGWSLKELHREILRSATYRQSSRFDESNYVADPDNVLLWRMHRRRLDVEAWRDAMLKVAGQLDNQFGGASFNLDQRDAPRRTLYGKTSRADAATLLKLFDFPEVTRHTEQRTLTTTPLQQLYFMNSPFMLSRAEAIQKSLDSQAGPDWSIRAIYNRILLREPSSDETARAQELIGTEANSEQRDNWIMFVQTLLASNEFLFID